MLGRLASEPLGDVPGLSCGVLEEGLEGFGWAFAMLWAPRGSFWGLGNSKWGCWGIMGKRKSDWISGFSGDVQ